MKKNIFIFIFLVFGSSKSYCQSLKAFNISYRVVDDKIEIFYDLSTNTDSVNVQVVFKKTSDKTFKYRPKVKYLKGDIGIGRFSGTKKKIIWDYKKEADYASILTGTGGYFELIVKKNHEKQVQIVQNKEQKKQSVSQNPNDKSVTPVNTDTIPKTVQTQKEENAQSVPKNFNDKLVTPSNADTFPKVEQAKRIENKQSLPHVPMNNKLLKSDSVTSNYNTQKTKNDWIGFYNMGDGNTLDITGDSNNYKILITVEDEEDGPYIGTIDGSRIKFSYNGEDKWIERYTGNIRQNSMSLTNCIQLSGESLPYCK